MGILMPDSKVIVIKADNKIKLFTPPDLKPDSTICGMRNDTTKNVRKILFDVVEKDYQLSIIAKKLYDDVYKFFVFFMETEELTDIDAYINDSHAYSIVKLTDEYAYLQESNNPHLYIKLKKETFIERMQEVATWKYE